MAPTGPPTSKVPCQEGNDNARAAARDGQGRLPNAREKLGAEKIPKL